MKAHPVRTAAALSALAIGIALAGVVLEIWWLAAAASLAMVAAGFVAVVRVETGLRAVRAELAAASHVATATARHHAAPPDAAVANRALQAALTARLDRLEGEIDRSLRRPRADAPDHSIEGA